MANLKIGKLVIVFLFGSMFPGFNPSAMADSQGRVARKIIVFKETLRDTAQQIALVRKIDEGVTVIKPLGLINALVLSLPLEAEKRLLEKDHVLRIDDDLIIEAIGAALAQPAQELPWGIGRIGGDISKATTTGLAVKVAVLDTGIMLNHPDLLNNIKGNVNTIFPSLSGNDNNGHGTHVAGTIAAVDNTIGVVGVGPEIYLYAVKALGRDGSGWLSDIIEGLEWCVNNNIQVVNMSFGSSSDNQSFYDAIVNTYQAGIVLVAAAGNTGGAVGYPARYTQVIAVSAIDENDALASFSSYGPEVDLTAPGVNILSTYKYGSYKKLNGTSMASPHVAGVAALILTREIGVYDTDSDGVWDPDEVKNKLEQTAENLGLTGNEQGAGLVRADLALQ